MELAVAILWFVAIFVWDLVSDYKKWLKNRAVKHGKEYWLRLALLIIPTVIFASLLDVSLWWGLAVAATMQGSLWWFLFDGLANVLRGYSWTFEGSIDENESLWDNFVRWLGNTWTVIIKVLLVAASITTYVKMFA